jgi:uroporphyrinogen III methyltransferase/synthase
MNKEGFVYIVGAGPGDRELITLKALEKLRAADCVLFDRLGGSRFLAEVSPEAELIDVGKSPGSHTQTQDKIIKILIEKAREGKTVVRLKGGDPNIFGRGSEEAIALNKAGIGYEIIPGISAAQAASALSGIPLTHRNLATKCIFLTAHEAPDKESSQIDWDWLAAARNTTIAMYMGGAQLKNTTSRLLLGGMAPDTAAAIVENAALPGQRVLVSDLEHIAETAEKNSAKPPMIVFIGDSVGIRNEIISKANKPLLGKRILATRALAQADSLYKRLITLGADVFPFATIKTEPCFDEESLRRKIVSGSYDWLVFTSENGVRYFMQRLFAEGGDARLLAGAKIAAIGGGTAHALNEFYIKADFIPSVFTSENLVKELALAYNLNGKKILRIKGDFAQDFTASSLDKIGAIVDTVDVYKILQENPPADSIEFIKANGADVCMFTSQSTVTGFVSSLGKENALDILNSSLALAIGPVTAEPLRNLGVKTLLVAAEHTIEGMLTELLNYYKTNNG